MVNLRKRYITILVTLVAIGLVATIAYFAYKAINASTETGTSAIVNSVQFVKLKTSRDTTTATIDAKDSKKINVVAKLEYMGDAVNIVPTIKNTSESNYIIKNIKLIYDNPDNDIAIRIPKITNGLILKGGTSEYSLVVEWKTNTSLAEEKTISFSIELEYEVVQEPEQSTEPIVVDESPEVLIDQTPLTTPSPTIEPTQTPEVPILDVVDANDSQMQETGEPEETASSTSEEI
jgi:hypothetical protein